MIYFFTYLKIAISIFFIAEKIKRTKMLMGK